MTERQGVEIDYCPQCRGVWLDRGELDKIVDRSEGSMPTASEVRGGRYDEGQDPRRSSQSSYKRKRKESFLGDLFDF
jgi:Zn-finger nucleic acid-binding protein